MHRVLALTGFDRSGTTFLGRHIQQHLSRSFFVGEHEKGISGLTGGRELKCSCGSALAQCSIWSQVMAELDNAKGQPDSILNAVCDKIFLVFAPTVLIDSSKDLRHVR